MITLDTSVLIRFFTNDVPVKAERVKKLVDDKRLKLQIPDVVFPELEYVLLGKTYNSSREKVLEAFKFLIAQKNITISKDVSRAIPIYELTNLDFADSIIAASSLDGKLFSYDNDLQKVKGVSPYK